MLLWRKKVGLHLPVLTTGEATLLVLKVKDCGDDVTVRSGQPADAVKSLTDRKPESKSAAAEAATEAKLLSSMTISISSTPEVALLMPEVTGTSFVKPRQRIKLEMYDGC